MHCEKKKIFQFFREYNWTVLDSVANENQCRVMSKQFNKSWDFDLHVPEDPPRKNSGIFFFFFCFLKDLERLFLWFSCILRVCSVRDLIGGSELFVVFVVLSFFFPFPTLSCDA